MHRILLSFLFLSSTCWAQFQNSTLPPCPDPPYNNEIAEAFYNVIDSFHDNMVDGIPSLGIPPLDPLGPLPSISFDVDAGGLVIDGSVNDTMVRHLSKYIVCEVTIEIGLRQYFRIDLRLDDFRMDGLYDVDGIYVSIFPIFGSGNYTLDTYNASINGDATIKYSIFTDHVSIKNLELDIQFEELELYLECILGCGDMADLINGIISEVATAIFNAVWEVINPILTSAIEDGLNVILSDINISDLLGPPDGTTAVPETNAQPMASRKLKFEVSLQELIQAQAQAQARN